MRETPFLYMWFAKSPGEEIIFDEVHYEPLKQLLYIIGYKMKRIKVIYKYTDTKIPCLFVSFLNAVKNMMNWLFLYPAVRTQI